MRMSARVALCAAALVSIASTHPLSAQEVPSPYRFVETKWEVGLVGGYADLASGRFGFGPKSAMTVGGRGGIHISGPLGFEMVADVLSGTRDVVDPGRSEEDRVVGEADVLLGSVEGRMILTLTGDRSWHRLAPYVSLGGGMVFDVGSDQPADEILLAEDRFDFGSSFLGTAGLGSRLFLSDRLVLRGDGLFSLNKIDTPPGFSDPDRGFEAVEEGEWVSGLTLTFSLGYRF